MIKMDICQEPFVFTSRDLVTDQRFIMDAGVGIGILYEVLSRDLVTDQRFIMDAGVGIGIGILYEVLED